MTYLKKIKMQNVTYLYSINILIILSLLTGFLQNTFAQTPVAANGKLSVTAGQLVNSQENPVQLRGMSTHGLQWYASCINFDAISAMTSAWGADVLRLAMYVEEDGYVTDPDYYKSFIDELVDLTGQFGIYCIIDWHVHNPGDPWANIDDAREFWAYMSAKHAGKDHVLYEICNEPNGVNWATVKTYAEDIIPIIRANDPNTVIIVGTPNWSQDVDIASQDPLNFDNVMYTLHFYSGTHGQSLRDKANTAMLNGIGIFVTEWGTSQSTGDGGPYLTPESDDWIIWMKNNGISWCNWSYADKDEVSAALVPGSCFGGEWNNTSISGEYVKNNMLNPADSWAGSENIPPVGSIVSPNANAKFELNETITVSAIASDQDGSVSLVEFYANGTKVGEDATSPYSLEWVANTLGIIELSIVITDDENETNRSSIIIIEILNEIVQYAYPDGIPHSIEGIIQGINYDVGGEGIAYHDADATNKGGASRTDEGVDTESSDGGNIGYIVNGEWLEYTVDVATAGAYNMDIRIASEPGGGQFHLEFDGVDKTGIVDVPSTGSWSNYQMLSVPDISLDAGEQVMRMAIDIGDFNYSTLTYTYTGTAIDPTGIMLSSSTLELERATTQTLIATVLPTEATNKSVTWTSSDATVASVNSSGVVTGISEGTANITATTVVGGFSDECTVTVLPGGDVYILTVNTSGQGNVTLNPSGGIYDPGTEVTLTAIANTGYVFDSWTGDISEMNATVAIVMDSDKTVTAQFVPDVGGCDEDTPITLPFTFDGTGEYCWVTSDDIAYVNSWALDLLEINGVDFTNSWSDQLPDKQEGDYYIHLISSASWAHLEIEGTESSEKQTYSLSTSISGEGTITIDPESESYEEGTTVSITANPAEGYYLESWSGDLSGSSDTISFIMEADISVQANFLLISSTVSYTLTVNTTGSGTVSPSNGEYDDGALVTLVATPDAGFEFVEWSGDISGTSSSIDVTMDNDKLITAIFQASTITVCENPVVITIPLTQNGIGEFCWLTSDDIAYVNSWNMTVVEINGVDFTNEWAGDLPEKINGNYYIYYQGLYSWAHLEIASTKSADGAYISSLSETKIYPNPFSESTILHLNNIAQVNCVVLYDKLGRMMKTYNKTEIADNMILGEDLTEGIYFVKVIYTSDEQTLILNKQ